MSNIYRQYLRQCKAEHDRMNASPFQDLVWLIHTHLQLTHDNNGWSADEITKVMGTRRARVIAALKRGVEQGLLTFSGKGTRGSVKRYRALDVSPGKVHSEADSA